MLLSTTIVSGADVKCYELLLKPPETDGVNDTLKETVYQAIRTNPDVLASCQAFWAATRQQDAARGGYLPTVDLTARAGYEGYRNNGLTSDYQPGQVSIGLNQMLYDGFITRDEVARLGSERRARFYELLESFEGIALESVTAYLDVLRYRSLLAYAEENLRQHEEIYRQVEERVRVGVGRGVDLDQAKGRLALARANHRTEANNLHDVCCRYLRLVGELPATALKPPSDLVYIHLPEKIEAALVEAFDNNPSVAAAFERTTAARDALKVRQDVYQPRLDLRAHHEVGEDRDRITGNSNETIVELVASFNLYRGGRDSSTIKQFTHLFNQSIDLRDKVCRNVRQELAIAMRDIEFLDLQLAYLKEHEMSSAKAREAYRNQFDIGQRTLLDLLDTENEYFEARRAYTIASYDYVQSYARSAANMGKLMTSLGLRSDDLGQLSFIGDRRDEYIMSQFCSAEGIPETLFQSGDVSPQPWLK
ncbi:MAG: TolC family outer membrane protein [Desulfuromonadaceae bacterium]|nr:TolC family outer membrane protein [Desulfuromonadaceae bacterium]